MSMLDGLHNETRNGTLNGTLNETLGEALNETLLSFSFNMSSLDDLDNETHNETGNETSNETLATSNFTFNMSTSEDFDNGTRNETGNETLESSHDKSSNCSTQHLWPSFRVFCGRFKSCGECTEHPQCGWCSVDQMCVRAYLAGSTRYGFGNCPFFDYGDCAFNEYRDFHIKLPCSAQTDCTNCTQDPYCSWCETTNRCSEGEKESDYFDCESGWATYCPHAFFRDYMKTHNRTQLLAEALNDSLAENHQVKVNTTIET